MKTYKIKPVFAVTTETDEPLFGNDFTKEQAEEFNKLLEEKVFPTIQQIIEERDGIYTSDIITIYLDAAKSIFGEELPPLVLFTLGVIKERFFSKPIKER